MTQALMGIVITQWRDPATTAVCLSHVAALSPQPHMVVVVDNESDTEILEAQRERFPDVRFLGLQTNTGHANAVNVGIRHLRDCGCEYALLLDNDAFVTPESLKILETAFERTACCRCRIAADSFGNTPGIDMVWWREGLISRERHPRKHVETRGGHITLHADGRFCDCVCDAGPLCRV